MQISDMLGQYNRNVTNGTEELHSAQGSQKLVSTLQDLAAGNIFEGTVSQIKNGRVTLALGNGQTIQARMDGKVDIRPGESMFFQVKSNDGSTVAIRPYTGLANAGNPILLNALSAAQVPVTERNLSMVDAMMQEHMSVGRQSILNMVRVLNSNPGISVNTLVTMTKLGIPVSEEMASRFEASQNGGQAILDELGHLTDQLADAIGSRELSSEDAFSLYRGLVDSFLGTGTEGGQEAAQEAAEDGQEAAIGQGQNINITLAGEQAVSGELSAANAIQNPDTANQNPDSVNPKPDVWNPTDLSSGTVPGQEADVAAVDGMKTPQEADQTSVSPQNLQEVLQRSDTLEEILSPDARGALTKLLQNIPTLTGNTQLFSNVEPEEIFVDTMQGEDAANAAALLEETMQNADAELTLRPDLTAGEFLYTLRNALEQNGQYGYSGVGRLFAAKEFKAILKNAIDSQWTIKPEEVRQENKVDELYEKMESQLRQMESAVRAAGLEQNALLQTAADVRGSIDFMNQMNQIYTYVQIPLKMTGQNANGELYVYTNKKQLKDPDAELCAFLHLDLDNLGATDVSVRMLHKNVKTNFYMEDDRSYRLVEQHLPILERHLKDLGYQCTITISNEKKEVDFVDDFLKQDQPPAGTVHRYSFDVRA